MDVDDEMTGCVDGEERLIERTEGLFETAKNANVASGTPFHVIAPRLLPPSVCTSQHLSALVLSAVYLSCCKTD